MAQILLVEDDHSLINGLVFALEKQGHTVKVAQTKKEALQIWKMEEFELVILDVTLPDGTGFEICKALREESKIPIIFLTAAEEETNITMGLDLGGDDYIAKPFKLSVLFSRINALMRRCSYNSKKEEVLASNGISIQLLKREVYRGQEKLELTTGEYKLLKYLMENADKVLMSEQILAALWDCDENYVDANTLTVYIRRLRKKIEEDPKDPARILTVRGMGYKWKGDKV